MQIKKQERVSFYTHFIGIFASIAGTMILLSVTSSIQEKLVSLIYGFSIIFLFSASSLYHALKQKENETSIWRKLDHLAIFFMIAGTYTPVTYVYLEGAWFWSIISIQWGLVLFGVFFKFCFIKAPRILYTLIYLAMGWMAIIPINKFLNGMTLEIELYLFTGAASFTIGAIIYALKKPTILPGVFGFHELFHLFILLGGILHYLMVYGAITG